MSLTTMYLPDDGFAGAEFWRMLDRCIHCGMCLQACPTYAVLGRETDSPRGRIALMRAAAEGRVDIRDKGIQSHFEICLACRSCESACPSGVEYGLLLESSRLAIERGRRQSRVEKIVRWLVLKQLMPHLRRLRILAFLAVLYQRSGMSRAVRALSFLPLYLRAVEGNLAPVRMRWARASHAASQSPRRGAVALFSGCIQEAFLSQVNDATEKVLQANGFDVYFPQGQTCCGAAHLHLGDEKSARALARRNIDSFLGADGRAPEYSAIISNAGGCGALLKDYARLLQSDALYANRARRFVSMIKDVSEFLMEQQLVQPRGSIKARVVYADSCHLRHAQRVARQPREILMSIPGIELVELTHSELCCGSAGVYNVMFPELADRILELKLEAIQAARPDLVVVSNTGCHLQLLKGIRESGSRARVVHLAELLNESYELQGDANASPVAKSGNHVG